MPRHHPRSAPRLTILLGSILFVLAAWILLAEPSMPGLWILGMYRTRWFLLSLGLSWALVWVALWAVLGIDRQLMRRLVLAHLGVFLGLAAAEGVSLVGWVDYRTLLGHGRGSPDPTTHLRKISRPNILKVGTAGLDLAKLFAIPAEPIPVSLSFDANGLRNPGVETDPGVVCIGDSLLLAELVPTEEILTERLGRLLAGTVYNVSESRYSPQEELIRLRRLELDLDDSLVIHFLFEGNDLEDSAEWRAWDAGPRGTRDWPKSGLLNYVMEKLRWAHPGVGDRRVGQFSRTDGTMEPVYFLYDGDRVDNAMGEMPMIARTIVAAKVEFDDAGTGYAVVFIPMKLQALFEHCRFPPDTELTSDLAASSFAAALEQACLQAGIPFLDSTPALSAAAGAGRLPFFGLDTHLNSVGHEVLADAVADWVRSWPEGDQE